MALEGRLKCVKVLLFSINIFFLLCGLFLIITGGVLAATGCDRQGVDSTIHCCSTAPIVGGVIIFLLAFLGCCGAWKENFCMVTAFTVLLSLILLTEIVLTIFMFIATTVVVGVTDKALLHLIQEYKTNEKSMATLDDMQQFLECCGVVNASDWVDFQPDGLSVPDTCCKDVTLDCGVGAMYDYNITFAQGCGAPVAHFLTKVMSWLGIAALVFIIIECLRLVLACVLLNGIRKVRKF